MRADETSSKSAGNAFHAIRPPSLRGNVAEVLRAALLDGRFQPKEELSDTRLAAEFAVSRGPVREALLVLAEEGLVVHHQNRGFEVPLLEQHDLEQISTVRRPLEVLALESAKARLPEGSLQQLVRLKEDLLSAFREGGIRVCARPDFAFHSAVWEMAGNPWLQAALKRVSMPYFAYVSAFNLGRRNHSAELMERMHDSYIAFLGGTGAETADECVAFHLGLE
jgi:DNA-binding GntR family transcriptional regulator